MDHKTFLSSLPAELTIQLTRRRSAPGVMRLTLHISLILLTGTLITIRAPLWPLLLPIHGIVLTFLFALEHETTHKTPFASDIVNDVVGNIVGLVIFLPFQWFRYFHLAHHRHTNDPNKDPELLSGAKPDWWPSFICYVSGLAHWSAMFRLILRSSLGRTNDAYLPISTLPRITSEARWMFLIYGILAISFTFTTALIWLWLLPLLLGQPFLRLFLLAEHTHCPPVADMFQNTRTTFTTRVFRFLTWNMSFHAEHHTMPNVPFHALPKLHDISDQHLQVTQDGYANFSRNFIAKL